MITVTRIDDRLIHGQVATQWVTSADINKIYIVDDETADDEFSTMVCKGLAPLRTEVFVLHTNEAVETLKQVEKDNSIRGLVITKTPGPLLKLAENGIKFRRIVVGGMGKRDDRKVITRTVQASDSEIEEMKKLVESGIEVVWQIVPSDKSVSITKLI